MTQNSTVERKNEILKRNISNLVLRENQDGLSEQDNMLKQKFIKELHQNSYELKSTVAAHSMT